MPLLHTSRGIRLCHPVLGQTTDQIYCIRQVGLLSHFRQHMQF